MEALTGLPPLELVIQGKTHHLWSHSCVLTRLHKSDPVFNMRVDVMKPVFNLEPKYWVTMLTRGEWTRDSRAPPMVKRLVWYTDGSRIAEGMRVGVYEQSFNRRLSIPLDKHATIFQAEVFAILACVEETATQRSMLVFALIVR